MFYIFLVTLKIIFIVRVYLNLTPARQKHKAQWQVGLKQALYIVSKKLRYESTPMY